MLVFCLPPVLPVGCLWPWRGGGGAGDKISSWGRKLLRAHPVSLARETLNPSLLLRAIKAASPVLPGTGILETRRRACGLIVERESKTK